MPMSLLICTKSCITCLAVTGSSAATGSSARMIFGSLGERARQRHALLLAAGELVGAHIRLIENADLVERFERLDLVLFAERTQQHAPEGHIRHARGERS